MWFNYEGYFSKFNKIFISPIRISVLQQKISLRDFCFSKMNNNGEKLFCLMFITKLSNVNRINIFNNQNK